MRKRALIIGFGKSGQAAALLAEKYLYDISVAEKNAQVVLPNYHCISDEQRVDPREFEVVIVSPGVSLENPLYRFMKKYHPNVVGEAQFALSTLRQKCFAITGSNGKTTMTLFLEHLLNSCGSRAKAVGNVGFAFSSYALNPNPKDILICELSSFQLETLKGPFFDGAAILNITPDHLDRYGLFSSYVKAKLNIVSCMKKQASLFMQEQDARIHDQNLQRYPINLLTEKDIQSSIHLKQKLEWQHSIYDKTTLAWIEKIAQFFHVSQENVLKALLTFKKPSHRLEFVEKINNISFFNDSKATNLESVIFALNNFSAPIHLILGGKDKGFDFSLLKDAFLSKVKTVLAIGETQEKIDKSLNKHTNVLKVETLDQAVDKAFDLAKPYEIVLLSPGCSSYDQFKHFEERGNMYKKYVSELKQRNAL